MKIIMLKGLPGSGKSTWAKEFVAKNPHWVRINKDDLRAMMSSYRPGKDEGIILKWRDHLIMASLREGKNVIVDDTNFHPKHEQQIKNLIHGEQGLVDPLFIVDFEVKFFDVPLAQCIKNDLNRPRSVGERVIKKMWREFLYQKYPAQVFDPSLQWAIICDMDGTLALHDGRNPYDTAKCDTDILNRTVLELMRKYQDSAVLIVSGRDEKFRYLTNHWLDRHEIFRDELYMRPLDDKRSDDIVKEEIYLTKIMGKYNVRFVLDDRNRVVDMWRRNGLTCLQVNEGDF